ncbi:hypothetical protein FRB97_001566 [Tulasnella sp. 331]|nr:hypothetical protein FRB97_001566 [Tulasnella sp. 331]KAG8870441.1 hypothetical protein FRB98_001634 [Tulasnella sp. 332]
MLNQWDWNEGHERKLRTNYHTFERFGDRREMADALYRIGKYEQGTWGSENAASPLQDAYEVYEELGDRHMMAKCAFNFAEGGEVAEGHFVPSNNKVEDSTAFTIYEELHARYWIAECTMRLVDVFRKPDQSNDAVAKYTAPSRLFLDSGDFQGMSYFLEGIEETQVDQKL